MKSIVNNNTIKDKPRLPKLMILPETKSIILAIKYGDGCDSDRPYGMLVANPGSYPIGELSLWSPEFVDFEGSVTLSND